MTIDTFATPSLTIPRDRWGRPLVHPPDGGKAVPYTRVTTVSGTLDDRWGLERWKMRQVAAGLSERPDLLLSVSAHRDDKAKLDAICEAAMEAVASSAGATTGTALHRLTELHDLGHELPPMPDDAGRDLLAYSRAMEAAGLTCEAVETFLVLDGHQVAGTADRIVTDRSGRRMIADLKTGSVDYSWGSIAIQLALYAAGETYDPETYGRENPQVDQDRALVIHLPAGQGECTVHTVDIAQGWEAAQLALRVRRYRAHAKAAGLTITTS